MKDLKYVISFVATAAVVVILLKTFGIYFALSFPVLLLLFLALFRKRT